MYMSCSISIRYSSDYIASLIYRNMLFQYSVVTKYFPKEKGCHKILNLLALMPFFKKKEKKTC